MAKITKSDTAPEGAISVVFGTNEIALDGRKVYKTDDPVIIEAAAKHGWLDVADDEGDAVVVPEPADASAEAVPDAAPDDSDSADEDNDSDKENS